MKDKLYVEVTAEKVYRRKLIKRIASLALCILLLLLTITYAIVYIVNMGGNFTITLDPNVEDERNIIASNREDFQVTGIKFQAVALPYMTNISGDWIDPNVDDIDGPHNGDNYIAYTFYIENQGTEVINYWYNIYIDDVIKNVDEAVRIMVFRNGEKKIYAKINDYTGKPEENTVAFYSDEIPVLEGRKNFKPNDIDKYTIVVWIEGDDPDCVNALIGGEIKMHMEITEEHIKQK